MAKKAKVSKAEFVLFDVFYEDGSQISNRRIPQADLSGFEGDAPAKSIIEAQDREIAERSGRPRGPIKAVKRVKK